MIIIAGASGFIGRYLSEHLSRNGIRVTCLTRNKNMTSKKKSEINYVYWDGKTIGEWATWVDHADAVINLCGAPIAKQWTKKYKKELKDSRIDPARVLSQAIKKSTNTSLTYIQASAVGYFDGHSQEDAMLSEKDSKGSGFISDLCHEWENEALGVQTSGHRTVIIRLGLVLGKSGGVYSKMKPAFQWGVGGHFGSGNQWFPWIHIKDVANLICFSLETPTLSGILHAVSPGATTMKHFCKALASSLNRYSLFHVPSWVLRTFFGEMATILLDTPKVVSTVHKSTSFQFEYPDLKKALLSI